jgi:hypothetical protein
MANLGCPALSAQARLYFQVLTSNKKENITQKLRVDKRSNVTFDIKKIQIGRNLLS